MIEDGYNDINAMRRKILKLKRELTQLREDRRVLAAEVNKWRDTCGRYDDHRKRWVAEIRAENEMRASQEDMPEADATDASGALGRATPP